MDVSLIQLYKAVRQTTEDLCLPLEVEDFVIQSIEDTSPPKWHLAHTSWFFETFLLVPQLKKYKIFHPSFNYLFNSYYQTINQPYPRAQRGLLSRPTVEMIYAYRHYVDRHLEELMQQSSLDKLNELVILGLNHEQQHQELLLMDVKHNFFQDKSYPVYAFIDEKKNPDLSTTPADYLYSEGGIVEVGNTQQANFCYDNELPRHQLLLRPFLIASQLVTNAEYLEFIEAGGYHNPLWWLSDGWDQIIKNKWEAPLYWQKIAGSWYVFTLNGLQRLALDEPVVHVSYYEAEAFARWKEKRLPLEAEWEFFVESQGLTAKQGNFLENKHYHPSSGRDSQLCKQFFGDVWEWTSSAYLPYPGYSPLIGALGEYNGKFMSNQFVLRGGCCVTPRDHIRTSYRNFFQPDKRWQFSGIRLAANV